jgi:hypothetical protein
MTPSRERNNAQKEQIYETKKRKRNTGAKKLAHLMRSIM